MHSLRKYIRVVSAFLLINFLFSTFLPTVSYALTSGPTAPEATSFEPIDTTDMVNPLTGDFTYNIPLLEVPGPSGGYPIGLSYHAGVMPNEEASWVGLGWTLNPGAISRNVNGFADDHNGVINTDRFFWEGEERHTVNIGASYGAPGDAASVSAGLAFSMDSNQGFGVGFYMGAGAGLGDKEGGPLSLNVRMGVNPYGDPSMSAGLGINKSIATASAGFSANANGSSGDANAGTQISASRLGLYSASIGANIGTNGNGIKSSLSLGPGRAGVQNNKSGNISTSASFVGIGIPTPVPGLFISLGYNYQRIYIDETENVSTYGSLYNLNHYGKNFEETAFDMQDIPNSVVSGTFTRPDESVIGTVLNFDNYNVNAQGLTGNIRPYNFKSLVYRQDRISGEETQVQQYGHIASHQNFDAFQFRFINDFSNKYLNTGGNFSTDATPLKPNFENLEETGENLEIGIKNNHLAGSRHIEYLTNNQIITSNSKVSSTGFMETKSSGFLRSDLQTLFGHEMNDQIGAFVITNESGVKYHYALPAYSWNEYFYTELDTNDGVDTFSEFKKPVGYAYTWFLTAITGPDFVDRGVTGEFDEEDWGYWVEFDYGKWSDHYGWRNPSEGMRQDLGSVNKTFATGLKQIYYLDKIKTKTHTALFVKEMRDDAKGISFIQRDPKFVGLGSDITDQLNKVSGLTGYNRDNFGQGSFKRTNDKNCICIVSDAIVGTDHYVATYDSKPVSSLKLDKIILIKNENIPIIDKSVGNDFKQAIAFDWSEFLNDYLGDPCSEFRVETITQHFPDNVLDTGDAISETGAIRVIDLKSTNEIEEDALVPETENSFSTALMNGQDENNTDWPKKGKLTLKEIVFNGKDGVTNLLPSIKFDYELNDPKSGSARLVQSGEDWSLDNAIGDLTVGDIIKFKVSSHLYYALISNVNEGEHELKFLGEEVPSAEEIVYWKQTKNPPHNKDNTDIWGMYKSDYIKYLALKEDYNKMVSTRSAKNTDVWSLRTISTQTGVKVKINYEPDDYSRSVFNDINLPISSLSATSDNKLKVIFENQFWSTANGTFATGHYHEFLFHVESLRGNEEFVRAVTAQIVGKEENALIIDVAAFPFVTSASDGQMGYHDPNQDPEPMPQLALIRGHIVSHMNFVKKGGGLRVKTISIENKLGKHTQFSEYSYLDPSTEKTSGCTSFEPNGLDYIKDLGEFKDGNLANNYRATFNRGVDDVLKYSSDIPAPGIIYNYVTIKEGIIENNQVKYMPSYSTYEFKTMEPEYIGIKNLSSSTDTNSGTYDDVEYSKIIKSDKVLTDFTNHVGTLKSITLYNQFGQKINETKNHYLLDLALGETLEDKLVSLKTDLSEFNNQGVIHETFINSKFVKINSDYGLYGLLFRKHKYPAIQTGQTTTNYKTGIVTTTENIAFDFFSGTVTKTKSSDGYGNVFITETEPAYRKYEGMGLALNGDANMLTQTAANYSYKVDPVNGNRQALMVANIQTWNDKWRYLETDGTWDNSNAASDPHPVWRKHKSYSHTADRSNLRTVDDGLMAYTSPDHPAFYSWSQDDSRDADDWQQNSAITLYDRYSHALEATDVNGNYAATKMDSEQEKVLSTIANAAYSEFAYSGAEDVLVSGYFGGQVLKEGTLSTSKAHTGDYSLQATSGTSAFKFSATASKARNMKVSVWSDRSDGEIKYKVNGGTAQSLVPKFRQSDSWYLLSAHIPTLNAGDELEVWCEAAGSTTYFDDFRVHPIDAPMTAYVYNDYDELTFVLDNNNLFTEYQYDDIGRLESTYRESFKYGRKKVSQYAVHYSTEPNSNK